MRTPSYCGAAFHRHRRLALIVFLYCFVVVVAVVAFVLPHLPMQIQAALTGPLSAHLSPAAKSILLAGAPQAPPAQPLSVIVPSQHPAAPPALPAAPALDNSIAPQNASQIAARVRELNRRDARLTAEIEQHIRQSQPPPSVESAPPPAPPPTPEEITVRGKIEQAKAKLAALLVDDTDQHPDVVTTREDLLALENRLQQLQIEEWSRRLPASPASRNQEQIAPPSQAEQEADRKVVESLVAARAAVRRQRSLALQQTDAPNTAATPGPAPTAEPAPASPASASASPVTAAPPQAPGRYTPSIASLPAPRFTRLGAALFGSPFALVLSLLLAFAAVLLADLSDPALRSAPSLSDQTPQPSDRPKRKPQEAA